MKEKEKQDYHIYIMSNKNNTVLCTGYTSNLIRRGYQHKAGVDQSQKIHGLLRFARNRSFTSRYNVNKLVYFEKFDDINNAIAREKQIKAGSRKKKIELINSMNPKWIDLYDILS